MSVAVIIPARGGSKGIPGKNKRLLGGIPLVARSIRAAKSASKVDTVYVSSDDPEVLAITRNWGAGIVRRPDSLADDRASSESALLHGLDELERRNELPEVLIFLQCTSPFTTGADIDKVLDPVLKSIADSAFSVSNYHGFVWTVDANGLAVGINHDHRKPRERRQDLQLQYRETGAVYAMRVSSFRDSRRRFCGRCIPVPLAAPAIEIDTMADWNHAEAVCWLYECQRMGDPIVSNIKAVVMDFDGVHTDDKVIIDQDGREAVICSRRDGFGVERLRKAGYRLLILSKEKSQVVNRRAEKLEIEVLNGVNNKIAVLDTWRQENNIAWAEIAYVGNDLNDVCCVKKAGLGMAPADADLQTRVAADIVLPSNGGDGAVRSIADLLLD